MKIFIFSLLFLSVTLTGCTGNYAKPDCKAEKVDMVLLFGTAGQKNAEKVISTYDGVLVKSYWEENLKTNDVTSYTYFSGETFFRWKLNRKGSTAEVSEYHENGNLKKRYWLYTGKILSIEEGSDPVFQYNDIRIGIEYRFDDNCTLTKTIDYDNLFEYTAEDIEDLLEGFDVYPDKTRIHQSKPNIVPLGYWTVVYKKKTNEWYEMGIDWKTGDIIDNTRINPPDDDTDDK
jgi:hypothetical protein